MDSLETPQTPLQQTPPETPDAPAPPIAGPTPETVPAVPAAEPASDPTQLPPQPAPPVPSADVPGNKKKLVVLAIIVIIILAIAAVAVFLLLPKHKTSTKLTVNNNPYLYACSATTPSEMASTLGYSTDRNLQTVETTYQYAPADTKDKTLDVLKTTGQQRANNSCQLFVAQQAATQANPSPTADNAYTSIDQFPTAADATTSLNNNKQSTDKPLPGFASNGFYSQPEADSSSPGNVSISAFVAYKSALIGYVVIAPMGTTSEQYVPKFEALAKAAVVNIDNGSAAKLTDLSGYTTIGGNTFTDACTSVNYAKITPLVLGGIDLNLDGVTATQQAGKDSSYQTPQGITSVCSFNFRANSEIPAEQGVNLSSAADSADTGSDSTAIYDAKFSHTLSVGITAVASASDVQQAIKQYTGGQSSTTLTPVTINGQKGYKANSSSKDQSGNTIDIYQYFLPKGVRLYSLQIILRRQTKPYNTTAANISDAEAFNVLGIVSQAQSKN